MNKKLSKFRILITTLTLIFTTTQNISALSLIDKMDYQDEKYAISEIMEEKAIYKDSEIINGEGWLGYVYKANFKYLAGPNMLHEFNNEDEYQGTITLNDLSNVKGYERRYLKHLEEESKRYRLTGFLGLPNKHISTIKDDNSYFNQLDNVIKPEVSCVPTVVVTLLHITQNKELKPDDLSSHISYYTSGSTPHQSTAAMTNYYADFYTSYYYNKSENVIKDIISEGKPVLAYINVNKVDYNYRYDGEDYWNRWNRKYKIKDNLSEISNHAILITGYLDYEDEMYLEIYDPISITTIWADGKPIPAGKGRFMSYKEFQMIETGPLVNLKTKKLTLK